MSVEHSPLARNRALDGNNWLPKRDRFEVKAEVFASHIGTSENVPFRLFCHIPSILLVVLSTTGKKAMNEGDAIEAAIAASGVVFSCFAIYISFTFGYLVTAYFVGYKLTRFQVIAANGLYVVAAGFMILVMTGWTQGMFAITETTATALDAVLLLKRGYWVEALFFLCGTGMLMSLYFMWDVRRQKM